MSIGEDFASAKQKLLQEFGLDTQENAMHSGFYVETDGQNRLTLQSRESAAETNGARIQIFLRQKIGGPVQITIYPNHLIWDSARDGIENISRRVRSLF